MMESNFVLALKETIIGEDIISTIMHDNSHGTCLTEENRYEVETRKPIIGNKICDSDLELIITCRDFQSKLYPRFICKGEWHYIVRNFSVPEFKVFISSVKKKYGKTTLKANYNNGIAEFFIWESNVQTLTFDFRYDSLWEPFSSFEYMENAFLFNRAENILDAFITFSKALLYYENSPYVLKDKVSNHLYDINFKDKDGRTIQSQGY